MSSHPFKVKAVFEYTSPHDEDLHFSEGQIITVTEDDEEDWYTGEYVDNSGIKQEGIFPRNFVEKYEPTAPPRPTRAPRPKKDAEPQPSAAAADVPSAASSTNEQQQQQATHTETRVSDISQPTLASKVTTASAASKAVEAPVGASQTLPKPNPPSTNKAASPLVADKPSGGSFRDRIAAFNKSAAPPPAPFKPGGLSSGGSGFIKKPFVAPPPSKDAYIPIPREPAPQKIYKREEDPEIAAREAENLESAEKADLSPTAGNEEEDQPKPTSLKERIALLQKQQMEQAARHADAVQKKEKPKRPPKKRSESNNVVESHEDEEEATALERQDSHGAVGKVSMDLVREGPSGPRDMPRRKPSKGPPVIPGFPRESFGDGNDADMSGAGDETEEPEEWSTGRDDSDDRTRTRPSGLMARVPVAAAHDVGSIEKAEAAGEDEVVEEEEGEEEAEAEEEEEEEEEEEIDPEVRRKEELRARMAKMSGGMGMHGIFGGGMPMSGAGLPARKKPSGSNEQRPVEHVREDTSSTFARGPPIPGIPLPGLTRVRSPEEISRQREVQKVEDDEQPITSTRPPHEVPDIEDTTPQETVRNKTDRQPTSRRESYAAPPVPGGRPAPPPVPSESRPPPPSIPMSPSAGSESDDEMSLHAPKLSVETPTSEAPNRAIFSQPSGPSIPNRPSEGPKSPRSPTSKRASYFANEPSPTTPTTPGTTNKRASRVPPIPTSNPVLTSQTRAPPPPPPGTSLSRSSTGDELVLPSPKHMEQDSSDEEVTEYEGDYDTDIASAAPHKDALKSSATESSFDVSTPVRSEVSSPSSAPPPLPSTAPHRTAPPPLPTQPPLSRQSTDMPRVAPPPPPPPKEQYYEDDGNEYDPYRYTAPQQGKTAGQPPTIPTENEEGDLYSASPVRSQPPRPQQERAAPPPPPREQAPSASNRGPPRQSMDVQRTQTAARRSTELGRMSMDSGFVANDVDLGQNALWWTQPNSTPPVFQNRKDILYETEESTITKRGGKSTTTRDLYVLFQDYSQTIITVRYDPTNPGDATLKQRHEPPPARLRQDQLEASHERFGKRIAEAVSNKKDTVVGDGTPQALVTELLKPFSDALLPVGTRAYGALVYGNLANASTSQYDEIRPGDIITLRNAKFQGKHGPMHAKYSMEVGGSGVGHVGIVAEWDGTKKKVRAWEQGREKKKVGLESFKLDDLRSGEVKIWRVMERGWIGWEGEN